MSRRQRIYTVLLIVGSIGLSVTLAFSDIVRTYIWDAVTTYEDGSPADDVTPYYRLYMCDSHIFDDKTCAGDMQIITTPELTTSITDGYVNSTPKGIIYARVSAVYDDGFGEVESALSEETTSPFDVRKRLSTPTNFRAGAGP